MAGNDGLINEKYFDNMPLTYYFNDYLSYYIENYPRLTPNIVTKQDNRQYPIISKKYIAHLTLPYPNAKMHTGIERGEFPEHALRRYDTVHGRHMLISIKNISRPLAISVDMVTALKTI